RNRPAKHRLLRHGCPSWRDQIGHPRRMDKPVLNLTIMCWSSAAMCVIAPRAAHSSAILLEQFSIHCTTPRCWLRLVWGHFEEVADGAVQGLADCGQSGEADRAATVVL